MYIAPRAVLAATVGFDLHRGAIAAADRRPLPSVGEVVAAVTARGGELLVTADHGNVEMMRDPETGEPHTAHTVGPVGLVYVGRSGVRLREGGALRDLAPTLLDMLGVVPPAEMTGTSLLLHG